MSKLVSQDSEGISSDDRAIGRRVIGGMNIHIFGSAQRSSFVKQLPHKRNPSGRGEYMNIHPPPPPHMQLRV